MAATKIYQIGEILFIDIAGSSGKIKLRAWTVDTNETHAYIHDVLTEPAPPAIAVLLSDVQNKAGTPIGTRDQVEEWIAYPVV